MAVSGLALAFASMGNLLAHYGVVVYYVCGAVSFALLCLWFLKLGFDTAQVKEELKNPIVLSIMPTVTLPIMLLCVYVKPYVGEAVVAVWWAANIAHFIIIFAFFKRFVFRMKIETVFPSWLICFVAILASSLTCTEMDARLFGQVTFYIGFALLFVAFPIVVYRQIKLRPLPEPARPTIAVFTAPMNFTIVGYFTAFEQPDASFVYVMLSVAVGIYIAVSVKMVSLVRGRFYPTFAAFTFPYIISAISFRMSNAFLESAGYGFFAPVAAVSEWIAVGLVAYVMVRYVMYFVSPFSTKRTG